MKLFQLFYEGISYLDEQRELKLRHSLKHDSLIDNCIIFDSFDDEENFALSIDKVSKWLNKKPLEKSLEIEYSNSIQKIYLHKELRNNFKQIWTEEKEKTILVIRISEDVRESLEQQDHNAIDNEIIDYYLGFTKVFKILINLKKPIVGHNTLLDLMFMYKQFYRPLPYKYKDFKTEIHQIFPLVYDTKYVSYELKKILKTGNYKI